MKYPAASRPVPFPATGSEKFILTPPVANADIKPMSVSALTA